jgi:NTE family protein
MNGPLGGRENDVRIALVLSAGGLRGAAHAGVMRALLRHDVPLHAIVGVSAGAIVAAYYAGVGLELDEMIADAGTLRGRQLLAHSLGVQGGSWLASRLHSWCGVIPERLRQLEAARFDRLHHGVNRLGIVCHDLNTGGPRYFGTGLEETVTLNEVVRASASIPGLFPAIAIRRGSDVLRLTDGGLSDPVPLAFAQQPAIGATYVIISDCCGTSKVRAGADPRVVWIRPDISATGMLRSPRQGLRQTVRDGEAAVTVEILRVVTGWLTAGSRAKTLSPAV